jgi:uncharacterized protein
MEPKLASIFIYPIKSFPGIAVQKAQTENRGLEGDRRYMLIDETAQFISVREEKGFLSFQIAEDGAYWRISHSQESMLIPKIPEKGEELTVRIWDDKVHAWRIDDIFDSWFSRHLGRACRLVYMPHNGHRLIKQQWRLSAEEVSFADGYPYLIINDQSLKDLEKKSGHPMDVRRFRANLVISGVGAGEEFFYREIVVGEVIFNGLKPCERCVVTTLDPDTGAQGKEPLTTLAKMKIEGKVVFGQHATLLKSGIIRIGDDVRITRRKESPYSPL